MARVFVDADPIVYMAGFAAESHQWRSYWIEVLEDGKEVEHELFHGSKTELNEYLAEEALEDVWPALGDEQRIITPEAESHALYLAKNIMLGIHDTVAQETGDQDVEMIPVLSGKGNFRLQLASIKPYKGNRDPEWKPYHYKNLRNYLTEKWHAKVIDGMEADDYCSIRSLEEQYSIISTIDKDLDTIPGWHYNYQKKKFYHVSPEDASNLEWVQTLAGDSTDNIPGIYRLGLTRAHKLVASWRESGLDDAAIWAKVVDLYATAMHKYPEQYRTNLTPEMVALEQTRLVRLLKQPGVLWTPPGMEPEVINAWEMEE